MEPGTTPTHEEQIIAQAQKQVAARGTTRQQPGGPWPWLLPLLALAVIVGFALAPGTLPDKLLRRGAILFGLGMLITLVTFLVIGESYVRFGILHALGSALVLALPFVRAPVWRSVLTALVLIGTGAYLNLQAVDFPWLIWLGLPHTDVVMVDYYPLLPWSGVALFGVVIGNMLYPAGMRRFALTDRSGWLPLRALQWVGQHALLIYLIHQPVLFSILISSFFVNGYYRCFH